MSSWSDGSRELHPSQKAIATYRTTLRGQPESECRTPYATREVRNLTERRSNKYNDSKLVEGLPFCCNLRSRFPPCRNQKRQVTRPDLNSCKPAALIAVSFEPTCEGPENNSSRRDNNTGIFPLLQNQSTNMTTFTKIPEGGQSTISVHADRRLAKISPYLYGGFTE